MDSSTVTNGIEMSFDIAHAFSTLSVNSNSQIIFTVIFLIFWSVLYTIVNLTCNFKSLSTKDANDVKNRIVSIVHGIASFWFASYEYLPYPVFNQPNTNLQTFIVLFHCLIAFMIFLHVFITDCLISHLFLIICSVFLDLDSVPGLDMVPLMVLEDYLLLRFQTFYMHLRVILRIFNRKNTKAYEYSENIYLATYMLFRGLICPIVVWYPCIISSNSPIVVKIMCTSLTLQSFYFIFQMINIIKKKSYDINK